jgi:hypothetical protein
MAIFRGRPAAIGRSSRPTQFSQAIGKRQAAHHAPTPRRFAQPHAERLILYARAQHVEPLGSIVLLPPRREIQPALFLTADVQWSARPAVVRGFIHQRGADRVAFHIRHRAPQVQIFERTGKESRLPDVSAPAVFQVEIARIVGVRAPHDASQGTGAVGHGDQVDVIAHQAVGPDAQVVAFRVAAEQVEIELAIQVSCENVLAGVAALGHLMRQAGDDNPRDSRHSKEVPRRGGNLRKSVFECTVPGLFS